MTFVLAPSNNVRNLFENWLKEIPKKDFIQIEVGVCTVILALLNTINDFVFNKLN
jgi:hypothetical protein